MAKIAIFASGNGSNFEVLANEFVNDDKNSVEILICNIKDAYVLKRAQKFNIPYEIAGYIKNERMRAEKNILKILKEKDIDVIFLAGFMKILTGEFIKECGIPIINIHPAILPKYKGTHSIERAFSSDDKEIGITIHYVIEEVDSGDIIIQKSIPLNRELGLDGVENEVHKLEHKWYPIAAKQICEGINKSKV